MKLITPGSPEDFDLCHPGFVTICGVLTDINSDDGTFNLEAEHYMSATEASETFPVRCLILDIPEFQKFKPIPSKGKAVSVNGFLPGLECNKDKTVKQFIIDIHSVTFLGQAAASVPKAEETTGTPACLKLTGFFGSQGSDSNSEEPPTKKQKSADDTAAQEVEDKGEGSSNGCPRRH
ncbi:hypothetical protein B0H17DRAFT_1200287 [Mycena rosella]|uniref:Uncharacterized protein n=1 Tax=Mycena rosella TaxID=1033263 RepID=A0AAD7DIW0_MYCRO|nr:hypothetical protein B0H17DRAFT_1200287 [Mycena rosella]